jgi:hypothetical protein
MDSWNRNQTAECADVFAEPLSNSRRGSKAEPVPHTSRKILPCGKLLGRKIFLRTLFTTQSNTLSSTALITAAGNVQNAHAARLEIVFRWHDATRAVRPSSAENSQPGIAPPNLCSVKTSEEL